MNEYDEKTGGPAFPRAATISPDGVYVSEGRAGMTLLDWFAGQAIAGLLASPKEFLLEDQPKPFEVAELVRAAYTIAHGMIQEKNKLWRQQEAK